MPTFEELRDECLKNGSLYADPDFPANNSSLHFTDQKPITWRRPVDIVKKPVFIREATYYDLNQGALGDCFFLAAVNSLMANDKRMLETVIPKEQNFVDKYAGIFRFNFWQYNEWKEIIIDDRLPVKEGDLLYSRNVKEPDEFWICLLEKAYAKLHGTYANIDGGFTQDVLVDLTGGISELIELKKTEYEADQMFKILHKMWEMDSLISMAIYQSMVGGREHKRENGLLEGHAYSVTRLATITFDNKTEKLIRLRNPWGSHEWNGAWSDKSTEWNSFSEEDRKEMGLTIDEEGEFWMRLEDTMTEFDAFDFCHKDESALARIITDLDAQKAKWSSHVFKDRWVKNVSSGGGDIDSDIYWRNPQYIIDLEHRTDYTWAVISLMEVMPQGREHHDIFIGFDIYQMKPGVKRPPSYRFDKDSVKLSSFVISTGRREKSRCIELPPGNIVIIVYNKEKVTCDFLMRIYCECIATVRPADDVTVPFKDEDKTSVADPLKKIFEKYCDKKEKNVDAIAMRVIIQNAWRTEFRSEFEITLETSRCLMTFVEPNHNGLFDLEGVREAFKAVKTWQKIFFLFDKNMSLFIEISELVNLLTELGLMAGRKVVESAAIRYGGRDGRLSLDDFIQCICRIFSINKSYTKLGLFKVGISLNEYISEVIKV